MESPSRNRPRANANPESQKSDRNQRTTTPAPERSVAVAARQAAAKGAGPSPSPNPRKGTETFALERDFKHIFHTKSEYLKEYRREREIETHSDIRPAQPAQHLHQDQNEHGGPHTRPHQHHHHHDHHFKKDDEVPHFGHRYLAQFDDRATRCSRIKFTCVFFWLFLIADVFLVTFIAVAFVELKSDESDDPHTTHAHAIDYDDTGKPERRLTFGLASLSTAIVVNLIGVGLIKFGRVGLLEFLGYFVLSIGAAFFSLHVVLEIFTEPPPSRYDLIVAISRPTELDHGQMDATWIPEWLNHTQKVKECCGIYSWKDFREFGPPSSLYVQLGIVPLSCCFSMTCEHVVHRVSKMTNLTDEWAEEDDNIYLTPCYAHILTQINDHKQTLIAYLLPPVFFYFLQLLIFFTFYIRRASNFGAKDVKANAKYGGSKPVTVRRVSSTDELRSRHEGLSMVTIPAVGANALSPEDVEHLRQIQLHNRISVPETWFTTKEDLEIERQNFSRITNVGTIIGPPLTAHQRQQLELLEELRLKRVQEEEKEFQEQKEAREEALERKKDDLFSPKVKMMKARLEGREYHREIPVMHDPAAKKNAPPVDPTHKMSRRSREEYDAEIWPWEEDFTPRRTLVITQPRPTKSLLAATNRNAERKYQPRVPRDVPSKQVEQKKYEFIKQSKDIGDKMVMKGLLEEPSLHLRGSEAVTQLPVASAATKGRKQKQKRIAPAPAAQDDEGVQKSKQPPARNLEPQSQNKSLWK